MNTRLFAIAVLTAGTLLAGLPAVTFADEYGSAARSSHAWRVDADDRRHGDFRRWRGGHWYHGEHGGRRAWWWVVPGLGLWYLYSAPVSPSPDPYGPPVAAPPTPNVPPPPAQYWYYCDAAGAYYPYVTTCPGGWQRVPATPPEVPAR